MERKFFDEVGCELISHDMLCVGDYGGAGSIGEANIRALEGRADAYVEHGSHGSKQLWLSDTESNRVVIEGLDDYCSVDDNIVSEVELEWEQEAWDSFARSDLIHTLDSGVRNVAEDLADDVLFELYREAMEKENEYPTPEYSGVYIPIERIKDAFNELVSDHLLFLAQKDSTNSNGPNDKADLGILADWCEETGHHMAEVVRYLANQEREEEPTTSPSLEG